MGGMEKEEGKGRQRRKKRQSLDAYFQYCTVVFCFLDPSAAFISHQPSLMLPLVLLFVSPRVLTKAELNTKGEQTGRKDATAGIIPLSK